VLEWNAQAEAVFGWSQQEAIGKSLGTLILLPSERARHRKRLERLLRTGKGRILGRRLQLQALRRDGKEITVELSITALRCRDRYVFNGFIRDLTEKLAAEAERHHAQKMEAIGQLTGGVAHDFNNLLTAIVGHLEVLAARAPKRWSARRHVEAALRAAWRGSGLTEQLLSFSRRREIHPEVVSIERLLRTATLLCQKTVGEGVEVVVRVAEDLWASRIDPGQFEAALLNLSANARDAMDGRGCLTITAENVPNGAKEDVNLAAGQYVVVSVTDTGRGMGKDVLARAFEPFYTTKEAGKGTGLGLSQVYGFATQSGGIARIASRKGRGTTVRLYVPRAEGKVRYERSLGDLPPAADGTATVLIVEDDADVRGMITEVLSHLGYSTVVATAGPEALATLRRNRSIDVLMSDNVMPGGLSGIELARIARKLRPGLKVLLSSGYTGEETGADLALGEFSFVAKPYRPGELATKLKEVLASR
jgi:PAS domain S-box-containing protein